ncbi:MAG: response regulator transcription factor [Anaerolineae bacterium]
MRVLLVDDHHLMVEALGNLLALHSYDVVGTAANGREAVALSLALQPDLILMDLRMPECDGVMATRLIKAQQPEIRIVMLTTSAEDDDLFAAIQSGACGYLLKSIGGKDFIEALHGLEEGIPPFSPGLAARVLDEFTRLSRTEPEAPAAPDQPAPPEGSGLSERQAEVLRLIASGMTYREVGRALSISERTVRYHMAEIMDRLHLEHRSQVIAYAGRLGLRGCP